MSETTRIARETAQRIEGLTRIRAAVAAEIDKASRQGDTAMMTAAVRARDALNEMLIAAGDEEAARCAERHYSLDELNAMGRYSGVGCPDCGADAEVEGDGVEIGESGASQEVSCGECGRVWINRYRFDSEEKLAASG